MTKARREAAKRMLEGLRKKFRNRGGKKAEPAGHGAKSPRHRNFMMDLREMRKGTAT